MKKALFMAIFGWLSGNVQAQTALEKAFLDEMNAYRKKQGLAPGIYHAGVSSVTAYHCKYLVKCIEVGHSVSRDKGPHDEQFDIPNHTERTFAQRTGMLEGHFIFGEISYPIFFAESGQPVQEIAKEIVLGFSRSPGHNEIMTTKADGVQILVGVSIIPSKSGDEGFTDYAVNINFAYK